MKFQPICKKRRRNATIMLKAFSYEYAFLDFHVSFGDHVSCIDYSVNAAAYKCYGKS